MVTPDFDVANPAPPSVSEHPYDTSQSNGDGSSRSAVSTGLTGASNIRSEQNPLQVAARVNAEHAAGFSNTRLENGPWNAVVMASFKADDPRIPPDTTNPNQRPVPWIVAYIPVAGCAGNSPHAHIPSPIDFRRDGTLEEQRVHWQSIELLFGAGVFLRGDEDPNGHLPQPNDRVAVTFYDVRNPGLGGIYNSTETTGYQSPTGLPARPVCERENLRTSTPSDASGNQAQAPSPGATTDQAPLNFTPPPGVQTGDKWAPHQGIIEGALRIAANLGVERQRYTSAGVSPDDIQSAYRSAGGNAGSNAYRLMVAEGRDRDEAERDAPCADFFNLPRRGDKYTQHPGIIELGGYLKEAFDGFDPDMCQSHSTGVRCRFPYPHVGIHAVGRAIDLFIRGGTYQDVDGSQRNDRPNINGDMVANWLVLTAAATGVEYVIWRGTDFKIDDMLRGRNGRSDRNPDRSPHNDHIHIDMSPDAAIRRQADWFRNQGLYAPDYAFLLPPNARVPI